MNSTKSDKEVEIPVQDELLLEEYRALNRLLLFRLSALDRSLPISTGFLSVAAGSILALPEEVRLIFLLMIPYLVVWTIRTAGVHAKAKADHIGRIAEIEQRINALHGKQLLVFQSHHPNRGATAGRSGQAILSVALVAALFMLSLCLFLFQQIAPSLAVAFYCIYLAIATLDITCRYRHLLRYQYTKTLISTYEQYPSHTHSV